MTRPQRRFYFCLALALGWPSVAWGLEHISSRELAEWQAFYTLSPFGDWRADLRSAIVASVIANANRDAKKRHKPFTYQDFIPDFFPKEKKGWKEMLEVVKVANAVLGGTLRQARLRQAPFDRLLSTGSR